MIGKYFELKGSKDTVIWLTFGDESERKLLYHDLYKSIFHDFWLIFDNQKNTDLCFVIHLLDDNLKLIKEIIFVGLENTNEAFVNFQKYFHDENFGGMEIFNAHLLNEFNLLSKGFQKPILSYDYNFDILKDFEIIDDSYKNIVSLSYKDICPPVAEIINEKNPLSLWGKGEKIRTKYHLWFDPNKDSLTSEKGTIEEDINQFNDNLYNPRFIGSFGQLDNVNIDYDKSSEYKRGTENNISYKYEYDINDKINKTIDKTYDIMATFILKQLNLNNSQSKLELIKNVLKFIEKHKKDLLTNYGFEINKNNINKLVNHILKKCM